tara:strand:- start:283 stop:510 length:228 start_codon:yes stop_codon:yes gene_type:complete
MSKLRYILSIFCLIAYTYADDIPTQIQGLLSEAGEAFITLSWNADTHSSGVYFVKIVVGSYVNTQKLMLVKQEQN